MLYCSVQFNTFNFHSVGFGCFGRKRHLPGNCLTGLFSPCIVLVGHVAGCSGLHTLSYCLKMNRFVVGMTSEKHCILKVWGVGMVLKEILETTPTSTKQWLPAYTFPCVRKAGPEVDLGNVGHPPSPSPRSCLNQQTECGPLWDADERCWTGPFFSGGGGGGDCIFLEGVIKQTPKRCRGFTTVWRFSESFWVSHAWDMDGVRGCGCHCSQPLVWVVEEGKPLKLWRGGVWKCFQRCDLSDVFVNWLFFFFSCSTDQRLLTFFSTDHPAPPHPVCPPTPLSKCT